MSAKPKHHHKTGKPRHVGHHYLKVYYPYLPLLIAVLAGLLLGHPFQSKSPQGLLGYATSVNSQDLLIATNNQRQANDQSRLVLNDKLAQAAQAKANDMVTRNYWSHNTPDGQPPWIFIDRFGYSYQKAGENLAYGFATSDDTISGWMNSAAHRTNLLDSAYKEVGFGFANSADYQKNGPETVVVAMYGTPLSVATGLTLNSTSQPLATTASAKNQALAEIKPQVIGVAQTLTGGRTPWVGYILSLLIGAAISFWALRHWLGIRKFVRTGERLLIAHPIFDVVLISLVAVSWILGHQAGVIR